nr:hypothetical protein [Corynebacterium ulcerans]
MTRRSGSSIRGEFPAKAGNKPKRPKNAHVLLGNCRLGRAAIKPANTS